MTFTKREQPGVFPAPEIELTLAERDGRCTCTWVLARYLGGSSSLFSLKYRDSLCPAGPFHRRLEAVSAQ